MTISVRSGFVAAVASVGSFLAAAGVSATVEVGWKRRWRQDNQTSPLGAQRVIFIPSDESGAGGEIVTPKFTGDRRVRDVDGNIVGDVRALADWERRATVSVWAVTATPEDESSNIEATESLLESVMVAIRSAPGAFGSIEWGDTKWTPPVERSYGAEVRVGFTYRHPIYFPARDIVYPAGVAVSRGTYSPETPPASSGDS